MNLRKVKIEKGELLFITCPGANGDKLEEIRQIIEKTNNEKSSKKSCVITNFDLKLKKIKISDIVTLKVKAEGSGNFELEDVRHLGDVIENEIKNSKEKRIRKNKFKFLLKT